MTRKILRKIRPVTAAQPAGPQPKEPEWSNVTIIPPQPKKMISLRIDPEVLDYFQAQGRGYQTRINAVLEAYVAAMRGRG